MPRAALTVDQIAAFRARAVDAATHLFASHGYDGVTMRALAAELGCSAMTPYRYFDNREALFTAVRTESFRRFADCQHAAFASTGAPGERLIALKRAYVRFAIDEPDAYRIMFELQQAPAGGDSALAAQSKRSFSYLYRAIEAAVGDGLLSGDALTLAHLLWANTHGLVSLHLAGKLAMGRSLEELAAVTLELPGTRS